VGRPRAPLEGVRPGLDRREAEPPLAVRDLFAVTLEVGIEGRGIRVGGVVVAAGGVGLPEFDTRRAQWLALPIQDTSRHVNDLPARARAMAAEAREVGIAFDWPDDGIVRAQDGAGRGGRPRLRPRLGRAYCHHPGDDPEFEEPPPRASWLVYFHLPQKLCSDEHYVRRPSRCLIYAPERPRGNDPFANYSIRGSR
jgi:hypothetical protein